MTRSWDAKSRREVLGTLGVAGFTAIAGCGSSGDGESDDGNGNSSGNGDNGDGSAAYQLSISDAPEQVASGSIFEMTVQVENTGDGESTETVTLTAGELERTTEVSLAGGESAEVSFQGRLSTDSRSETVTATVEGGGASTTHEFTVYKEASFELSIVDITDEIETGQQFEVTVEVTNTGGVEATKSVSLDVPGLNDNSESTDVTLAGGESTTVTLGWSNTDITGATDASEISVTAGENSVSNQISVLEPASFEFEIANTNSPITAGDTLSIDVAVTNVGDATGTTTVDLSLPVDLEADSAEVTVDGGETETVSLTWESADPRESMKATVSLGPDSRKQEVSILEPASFDVELVETNSPVVTQEPLTIDVAVENVGQTEGTGVVSLNMGNEELDSTEVTIDGGDTLMVSLEWTPERDHVGDNTATVDVADSSVEVDFAVQNALSVVDSTLIETMEDFAEIMEVTIENRASSQRSGVLLGEITVAETDKTTNRMNVSVEGNATETFRLKIPTEYIGFAYNAFSSSYTTNARLDPDTESAPELSGSERIAVTSMNWSNTVGASKVAVNGTVENITDTQATATVRGSVEAGDPLEVIDEVRQDFTLGPQESEDFEVEMEWEDPDLQTFWVLEVVDPQEDDGEDGSNGDGDGDGSNGDGDGSNGDGDGSN